jgi:hypothetical protein
MNKVSRRKWMEMDVPSFSCEPLKEFMEPTFLQHKFLHLAYLLR